MSRALLLNTQSVLPSACPRGRAGERSLNWLALGLLLAAWNAADDDARAVAKPPALRAHAFVSVRAVARATRSES